MTTRLATAAALLLAVPTIGCQPSLPRKDGLRPTATGDTAAGGDSPIPHERRLPTAAQDVMIEPAAVVSPPASGVHFWWTSAASATDPHRLVVCALRVRGGTSTVQAALYGSTDGGISWRALRADSTSQFVSEVTCGIGAGSTVYFVNSPQGVSFQQPGVDGGMLLERSTDFGEHWRAAPRAVEYVDAAALVVRPGGTADHDSLYVFADGLREIALSTFDGGRTLGPGPLTLPDDQPSRRASRDKQQNGVAILPDGSVGGLYIVDALWQYYPPDSLPIPHVQLLRVTPGGQPLGAPITVATFSQDLARFGRSFGGRSDREVFGTIAADHGAKGGPNRTYVAWNAVIGGRIHIVLVTSDNNGVIWSQPRIVDDLPAVPDGSRDTSASVPSLAVNKRGVVGLQWAEFAGRCWRFAASRDRGTTFLPSVPLNTCPRRALVGTQQYRAYLRPAAFYDSAGSPHVRVELWPWHIEIQARGTALVATADGAFHPTWVVADDGEGLLYTSRVVVVRGGTSPTAAGRLAARDVPVPTPATASGGTVEPNATLDFAASVYDEGTGEFVLHAVVVRRRTPVGLCWPVIVRLKRLSSPLGSVTVVGADNGLADAGATWTVEGPARALQPGSMAALDRRTPTRNGPWEFSKPRPLRVRLTTAPPVAPPADLRSLLDLDVEIVAPHRDRHQSVCPLSR